MDIKIAENGKCLFTIMTPKCASAPEKYAADQLKMYLDKITSLNFPLETEGEDTTGAYNHIYIGIDAAAAATATTDALGEEEFIIEANNNDNDNDNRNCIRIAGGGPRGLLYGVYEFLEQLGCRFFTPHCERIPSTRDLSAPKMSIRQKPALEYREHCYRFYYDYPEFAVKSRVNGDNCRASEELGGHISYAYFVHTFNKLLPPDEYYDSHPEYFSLVDGKRQKKYPQLCLTNPDVLSIVIENVKTALREKPGSRIISVSQNDWDNHCDCDSCKAIDEREGARSGSLIAFINAVAEAIEPEFPDVLIDTLAYQQTRPAPKFIRPRHNVCVRLCTIENCLVHPFESCEHQNRPVFLSDGTLASFSKDMKDWAKVCDRLYVWNYVTCFAHYCMPFPNWKILQPHMKFMVGNNLKGLYQQGNFSRGDGLDLNEMRAYVITKLLWDPDADVETHMREFADYFYGPAGKYILEYAMLLADYVEREDIHICFNDNCDKAYLTDERLDQYDALLKKAAGAVAGDAIRSLRVFRANMPLRYVRLKNNAMKGKLDKAAIDQFFEDCTALGVSRIDEWVGLEKTRRAMYDGKWRGVEYLVDWWDDGGEPYDYLA